MPAKRIRILKILTAISFLLLLINVDDVMWLIMLLTLLLGLLAGGAHNIILSVTGIVAISYLFYSTYGKQNKASDIRSLLSIVILYYLAILNYKTLLSNSVLVYISYLLFVGSSVTCICFLFSRILGQGNDRYKDIV